MKSTRNEQGMALLAVLWGLLLLSTLAAAAVYIARTGSAVTHLVESHAQAELTSDAAIAEAISRLSQLHGESEFPADGTPIDWSFGEDNVEIKVSREESRIDLNSASDEMMTAFLSGQGIDHQSQSILLSNLKDWQGLSKAGLQSTLDARRLIAVGDLALVPGWTAASVQKGSPSFTVVSQLSFPDGPGITAELRQAISWLERQGSSSEPPLATQVRDSASLMGQLVRIETIVRQQHGYLSSSVWIGRITGDKSRPMLTMRWDHGQTVREPAPEQSGQSNR